MKTVLSRAFALLCAMCALAGPLRAQNVFQITSASPSFVPAGANGITLTLGGFSAAFASGNYEVCFYTGYGSNAALTPAPASQTTATITVPASTIQNIPAANFTAANQYTVGASIYVVQAGTTCDGVIPSNDINFIEPITEPLIGGIAGSTNVPKTNSATSAQAAPFSVVLTGSGFSANTVVTFGSFGTATATVISPTTLSVLVPAAFASSAAGTTAPITACNTGNFCSGASSPVTLTVTALTPSAGTLTITPTPTTTSGTTTLTAQFKKQTSATGAEPGVPSGIVTFAANSAAISTGQLSLDTTATLVAQSTTTQFATTATPVISPAAGSYAVAQTISLSEATPGATIYYTLDGSTPTTSSRVYQQPFVLSTTATVTAIAVAAGSLPSAAATSTFTIFVQTPTSLAFSAQPVNTATTTVIAPPVTVSVLDQNGNVITTSTAAVTLALAANPGQSTLNGTLTANAVNGVATFSDLSIVTIASGYTLRATSAGLTPATSSAFNITPYPITVKLFDPLIGVTSTLSGSFTLTHPAPAGGVTVSLASGNTSFITVSPATVNVAAGGTTGTFTYTGVGPGTTTITASAPNYLAGSANITSTYSLVSLGTIPTVAPGQTVDLALSLATNAPAGGVTVSFTSTNSGVATVTPSVFIPAGQRIAAANPQIVGVTIGTTTITATAQGYAPDTRNVSVSVTAGFNPNGISINHSTAPSTLLSISAPAQTGGLTFTLTSDDPTKATVASTATIPAGQTSVTVPVTGVADGSTRIRANTPGVTEAVLNVNITSQLAIYYGNTITGVNLQVVNYVFLPVGSPTPVTVTVTVADPTIAQISTSPTAVGSATLTFPNTTSGGNISAIYFQGLKTGSTTITVSAPGYTTGSSNITVYPSGFVFSTGYNGGISTTTFSGPTNFYVYPALLTPGTLAYYNTATLSPGLGPISVPATSSNTATGTITTPVVFNAGDTQQFATFTPGSAGTTNLSLGAPSPATGFSTPSNYQSFTETVTAPQATFYYGNQITGVNTQIAQYVYFPVAPPSGVTVTITASNSNVTLSKSATAASTATTLTYTNVTGSGTIITFYTQGQAVGTTTLTLTATGFTGATTVTTVYPTGFVFSTGYNGGVSTTTFSGTTNFYVYPALLSPGTLAYYNTATLNPGLGPISVPVTSSNTTTGTITSPIVFNGGDTQQFATFTPGSAGTTTLALGAPSPATGFSTPSNYQAFTETVTAPQASFYYGNQITGVNTQIAQYVYFPVAPPSGVTVTITASNSNVTLSKSETTASTATSLTYTNVTGSGNIITFYTQGQAAGSTILTLTATGFTGTTTTTTVYPSGFVFSTGYNGGVSTSTFSAPSTLYVYPALLSPGTLNYYNTATLNPGIGPISIPVVSSNTVVGTISGSPLMFVGDTTQQMVTFQPTSAGTTTISLGSPSPTTGFSIPSNYQSFTATVTAPQASIYYTSVITGANLQVSDFVYLQVAPPNPVTVTVTSNGPSIATLSTSPTTVGTSSISFTNVTGAGGVGTFYIQGLSVGSTTLTVSVPGYTNGQASVTVYPSGFTFAGGYNSGLNTTTSSSTTQFYVYASILNPGTLTYYTTGTLNPGLGGVSVPVTSSNPAVGTITVSPLVFGDNSTQILTGFKPLSTGTSNISITQPAGFSQPSNYTGFTATVTAGTP